MSNSLIELRNISKTYALDGVAVKALNSITVSVKEGEFVAIMGPSGSGKSTLMNIIGCLDKPSVGDYFLNGRNISKMSSKELSNIRKNQIGFVFQNFNLLPYMNALKNTELPLTYTNIPSKERKEIATELLNSVGLGHRIYHRPNELSGGEKQRVAIARALANKPRILLGDEPTGNLDSQTSEKIMGIMKNLNNRGITIIIVTHEMDVAQYARLIVRLRDGNVVRAC